MNENLRMIWYMIHKDPLVIAGLVLVGFSGLLLTRIQLRMMKSGYKFPYVKYLTRQSWEVPQEYLNQRMKHGCLRGLPISFGQQRLSGSFA